MTCFTFISRAQRALLLALALLCLPVLGSAAENTPSDAASAAAVKLIEQAEKEIEAGDFAGALANYDKVVDEYGAMYSACFLVRAWYRERFDDLPGGLADLDKALNGTLEQNTKATAHANRGFVRALAGDEKGAQADYEQAQALGFDAQEFKKNHAQSLANAHLDQASAAMRVFAVQEAVAQATRAIELSPSPAAKITPLVQRSVLYARQGATEQSEADFAAAKALAPEDKGGLDALARSFKTLYYSGELLWISKISETATMLLTAKTNANLPKERRQSFIAQFDRALEHPLLALGSSENKQTEIFKKVYEMDASGYTDAQKQTMRDALTKAKAALAE